MKNLFPLLLVFVFLTSCKDPKKEPDATVIKPLEKTCEEKITDALKYPENVDNEEVAAALKECGGFICENENLLDLIEPIHKKDETSFNNYKIDFWKNANDIDYKIYKWIDIKKEIENHCYDKYLSFSCNSSDVKSAQEIKMSVVNDFSITPTCYSPALFKSILKKYPAIKDATEFKFTKANIKGKTVVVFEVDDANIKVNATYDMSQIPVFLPSPIELFKEEILNSIKK